MGIKTLPVVLSLFSPRVLQPARLDRGLGDPEGGIKLINALISAGVELLGGFPPFSLCQPHPSHISQSHTGGGVGVGWNFWGFWWVFVPLAAGRTRCCPQAGRGGWGHHSQLRDSAPSSLCSFLFHSEELKVELFLFQPGWDVAGPCDSDSDGGTACPPLLPSPLMVFYTTGTQTLKFRRLKMIPFIFGMCPRISLLYSLGSPFYIVLHRPI